MGTIRTFIAVALPDAYQGRLTDIRRAWAPKLASKLGWTRPGNWHVTLTFLGDTDEALLPELRAALDAVAFAPFVFQAGGAGFFPNAERPRVAWVGAGRGGKELAALALGVQAAVEPLGFAPERRPFTAHLTVARIKKAARDPWQEFAKALMAREWPAFELGRFVLFKSTLTPGGPVYEALAAFGAS